MAKKILLADDSLTIQKVVELTFSDSDYDLVCVSNGHKALEKVREDRPDLILADVVMPEKNGYEVCEEIKGNPATSRIPVVLLSGTFEPFDRQRAERIGCDAIVSKPFDSQQLIAQVEILLARAPKESSLDSVSESAASEPQRSEAPAVEEERGPFETGFAAEDFTASLRVSPLEEKSDLFEEEYGRGDVDSAILAFERSAPAEAEARPAGREPSPEAPWLLEESESASGGPGPDSFSSSRSNSGWGREEKSEPFSDSEKTGPIPLPFNELGTSLSPEPPQGAEFAAFRADDAPTVEMPREAADIERLSFSQERSEMEEERVPEMEEEGAGVASWESHRFDREPREISEYDAEVLFDVPSSEEEEPAEEAAAEELSAEEALPPLEVSAGEAPSDGSEPEAALPSAVGSAASSKELEALAKTASIPELNTMLSSLMQSGEELSDAEIDRLAKRVLEKLSDRVVREIAWEVIPDMAEIVIRKRIKELEAGAE